MKPHAAGALLALAAAGCAGLGEPPFAAHLRSESEPLRACAQWYAALDDAVAAEGVGDAQHARVPGFPYLRVNRILASLRDRAAASESALHAFVERLGELELEARRHELQNLSPRGAYAALRERPALRRSEECARLLREADLARPQARAALLQAAQVPDDYSTALRVVGLYALVRVPFAEGVRRWEQETLQSFREPQAAEGAVRVRYAPAGRPLARRSVAAMLARAAADPLGMPLPSASEAASLAETYAPSFDIEVVGDYDRFGALRWRRGGTTPQVNAAEPVAYFHLAHTRYREQVLLQLVYTIWFSERPARSAGDLLSGPLDALVWRVTLAPGGEPVIHDSMHACGCYHEFFPTPLARLRPAPDSLEEWAFVPHALPRLAEGERPLLRVASGTHYIEGVSVVRGPDSVARYAMRGYDELRSLVDFAGGQKSAFGPDGLIPGTQRAERFLFWPMGIASPGAMRQWGRHATAFVGRRHFDDADLLERRFELELPERPR
jgi:hypothetical protein